MTRAAARLFAPATEAAENFSPGPLAQIAVTLRVPVKELVFAATAANIVAPAKVETVVSIVPTFAEPPVT